MDGWSSAMTTRKRRTRAFTLGIKPSLVMLVVPLHPFDPACGPGRRLERRREERGLLGHLSVAQLDDGDRLHCVAAGIGARAVDHVHVTSSHDPQRGEARAHN